MIATVEDRSQRGHLAPYSICAMYIFGRVLRSM